MANKQICSVDVVDSVTDEDKILVNVDGKLRQIKVSEFNSNLDGLEFGESSGSKNLLNIKDIEWITLNQGQSKDATFCSNAITLYPNTTSDFNQAYGFLKLSEMGLKVGDTICISANFGNFASGSNPSIILDLFKSDKITQTTYCNLSGNGNKTNLPCIIPNETEYIRFLVRADQNRSLESGTVTIKDIQIEKGSTATSYVPYQHL